MDFTGPQFRLKYLRMCVLENITNVKSVIFTFKEFVQIWPASLSDDAPGPPLNSVKDLTIYGFGREASLRPVMEKIIPYFPNVCRIEAGEQIGRLIFEIIYQNVDTLSEKDNGLKSFQFRNLTHIDFNYIYPTQLESIIFNRIRLKSLKGGLHMCTEKGLTDLFEFLSPTVEELALDCQNSIIKFAPRLPMPVLTKLELTRFQLDLGILVGLPMLKMLKLKCSQILWGDKEEGGSGKGDGNVTLSEYLMCVKLEICEVNESNLDGFGKIFGSVKKLDLVFCVFANMEIFRKICRTLQNLEEVHLTMGVYGEEGLKEIIGDGLGSKSDDESDTDLVRFVKVYDRESKEYLGCVQVDKKYD